MANDKLKTPVKIRFKLVAKRCPEDWGLGVGVIAFQDAEIPVGTTTTQAAHLVLHVEAELIAEHVEVEREEIKDERPKRR